MAEELTDSERHTASKLKRLMNRSHFCVVLRRELERDATRSEIYALCVDAWKSGELD